LFYHGEGVGEGVVVGLGLEVGFQSYDVFCGSGDDMGFDELLDWGAFPVR